MEKSQLNLRQSSRPLTERSAANLVLPRLIKAQRDARRKRVERAKAVHS